MHQLLDLTDFRLGYDPHRQAEAADYCIVYYQGQVYLENAEALPSVAALKARAMLPESLFYLGDIAGRACFIAEAPEAYDVDWVDPRWTVGVLSLAEFQAVAFGHHTQHWLSTHRYCGCCGALTAPFDKEKALFCKACEYLSYPKISPCVVVLVHRGNEFLLGRSPFFREGLFSLLAGFVEIGESLEGAVHRELMEEVGIHVKNVRYVASQPWPFPSSLMTGFYAEYDSGEIQIDGVEIEAARWFSSEDLPNVLPSEHSLSRYLLDQFLINNKL